MHHAYWLSHPHLLVKARSPDKSLSLIYTYKDNQGYVCDWVYSCVGKPDGLSRGDTTKDSNSPSPKVYS